MTSENMSLTNLSFRDLKDVNSKDVYNQLSEFTRIARYAQYNNKEKRRETWDEQVDRVFKMHHVKYAKHMDNPEFRKAFEFAKNMMLQKKVLGSQRALQFGGPAILNKNARIYNCAATYVDRPSVFQEVMFSLLCGVGMGFSVQTHHVDKLPNIKKPSVDCEVTYDIPDSIEGWSDAIGVMVHSYFDLNESAFSKYAGKYIKFNYDLIRPKGSSISHMGGKAPGPDGLKSSIEKIRCIFDACIENGQTKLRPIDAYDILMHCSDAVLSGGIRRAATIALFSLEDEEMIKSKTGDWYITNPQRARSNNSALLLRDSTPKKKFMEMIESIKQFGEPGIIFSDSTETLFNPCVEISLRGYDDQGRSGIQFCNLSEINMRVVENRQQFLESCEAAAILGTLQAGYTEFGYLGKITQSIVERESLTGVSMTGMMDSPSIAFSAEDLRLGACKVKEVNKRIAELIGINQASRTTCVKPAGSTSCILSTASGIHPRHAKRYFRRVQVNKLEEPLAYFRGFNPQAIEESVWSSGKTDDVITFLCKSNPASLTKSDVSAIDLLHKVKLVQQHWVTTGKNEELCVDKGLNHNVSNTITIESDEWDEAAEFIYDNRKYFAGISMLSASGDMTYQQAPFQEVLSHDEIAQKYGGGSVFASGLIVHAHSAFDNNLYDACSCLLGYGEKLEMPTFDMNNINHSFVDSDKIYKKIRWIAQADKFAKRYFGGDKEKMTHCLKSVDAWHKWCNLKRTYQHVPWEKFYEEENNTKASEYVACSGGSCTLIKF